MNMLMYWAKKGNWKFKSWKVQPIGSHIRIRKSTSARATIYRSISRYVGYGYVLSVSTDGVDVVIRARDFDCLLFNKRQSAYRMTKKRRASMNQTGPWPIPPGESR